MSKQTKHYKSYGDLPTDEKIEKHEQGPTKVVSIPSLESFNTLTRTNNGDVVLVIDVYADWCAPCKYFSKDFDRISNERTTGRCRFYKANIDNVKIPNINNVPTFLIYKGSVLQKTIVGAEESQILEAIQILSGGRK